MFGIAAFSEAPISATAEASLPLVVLPIGAIGAAPLGVHAIGKSNVTTGGLARVNAVASAAAGTVTTTAPAVSISSTAVPAGIEILVNSPAALADTRNIGSSAVGTVDVTSPTPLVEGGTGVSVDPSQSIQSFVVTVQSTAQGNKYFIDGTQQDSLVLHESGIYTFDTSDTSVSSHPFRFSTTPDGTHGGGSEYTTGVTVGSGYVEIVVTPSTPDLYYYCSVHSGMGSSITFDFIPDQSPFIIEQIVPGSTASSSSIAEASLATVSISAPLVNETVVEIVLNTPSITVTSSEPSVFIGTVTEVAGRYRNTISNQYDQSVAFSLEDPTISNIEKRWLIRSKRTGTPDTINERFFAAYYTSATNPYNHDINVYEVDSEGALVTGSPVNSRNYTVFSFLNSTNFDQSVISTSGATWFDTGKVIIPYIIEYFNAPKVPTVQQMTFDIDGVDINGNSRANLYSQLGGSYYAPEDSNGNSLTGKDFHSYRNNDGAFPYYGTYDGRDPELYLIWMFGAGSTKQGWITNGDGNVNEELYNTSTTSVWQTIIDGYLDPANNLAIPDASGTDGLYSAAPDTTQDNQGLLSQRHTFDNQVFLLNKYILLESINDRIVTVGSPGYGVNSTSNVSLPSITLTKPTGTVFAGAQGVGNATLPVITVTNPVAIPTGGTAFNATASLPEILIGASAPTNTVSSTAGTNLPIISVGAPLTTETVVEIPLANPPITVLAPEPTTQGSSSANSSFAVVVTITSPASTLSIASTANGELPLITVSPAEITNTVDVIVEASLPQITTTAPESIEAVIEQVALPQVTLTPAEAALSGSAVATYALTLIDAASPQANTTAGGTANTPINVAILVGVPGVDAVGTSGDTASASPPQVGTTSPEATLTTSSSVAGDLPQVTVGAPLTTETVVEIPLAKPPINVGSPVSQSLVDSLASAASNTITVDVPEAEVPAGALASASLIEIPVAPPEASTAVVAFPEGLDQVAVTPFVVNTFTDLSARSSLPPITVDPPEGEGLADIDTEIIACSVSIISRDDLVFGVFGVVEGLTSVSGLLGISSGSSATSDGQASTTATETQIFALDPLAIGGLSQTNQPSADVFGNLSGTSQGSTTTSADVRINVLEVENIQGSATTTASVLHVESIAGTTNGSAQIEETSEVIQGFSGTASGSTNLEGRSFVVSPLNEAAVNQERLVKIMAEPSRIVGIESSVVRLFFVEQPPSRVIKVA